MPPFPTEPMALALVALWLVWCLDFKGLFWVGILLYFGIPMLGWIATLISMKFYPLDDKKMVEIQSEIARIKAEA